MIQFKLVTERVVMSLDHLCLTRWLKMSAPESNNWNLKQRQEVLFIISSTSLHSFFQTNPLWAEKFEGFKLQQQCVSEDESFSWISCSNLGQIMLGWTTLCILCCVTTCVDSVLHDQILLQSLIKLCRQNHQVVAHVCKYFNGSSLSIVLVPMSWRRWMNQVFSLVIDRSAIITTFCTLLSSISTVELDTPESSLTSSLWRDSLDIILYSQPRRPGNILWWMIVDQHNYLAGCSWLVKQWFALYKQIVGERKNDSYKFSQFPVMKGGVLLITIIIPNRRFLHCFEGILPLQLLCKTDFYVASLSFALKLWPQTFLSQKLNWCSKVNNEWLYAFTQFWCCSTTVKTNEFTAVNCYFPLKQKCLLLNLTRWRGDRVYDYLCWLRPVKNTTKYCFENIG